MHILYIEDDASSRMVLHHMLTTVGVSMTSAADGKAGLDQAAKGNFDMILMDLRMPDMSGLTALRHIRARQADGQRTPIVFVSAEMSDGAQAMCRAAGADGFVDKPVNMDRLFAVLAEVISESPDLVSV